MEQLTGADIVSAWACRDLTFAFAELIDRGEATAAAGLFTDSAVMVRRGNRIVGREAITAVLAAREADSSRITRHVITNFRFLALAPDSASSNSISQVYTLAAGPPTPPVLSDLQDEFARCADGLWRFSGRTWHAIGC
jgi:SnoaL-like domain